jgi:hypothetical protein
MSYYIFGTNKKYFISQRSGFVIFFALIVSSIVLTAGLAVSRIIIRQIYLASVQRDSQVALFGAESGKECARYYYQNPTITDGRTCNDAPLVLVDRYTGEPVTNIREDEKTPSFWFNLGGARQKTCVRVEVDNIKRMITSRGYNVECDGAGKLIGGRIIESKLIFKF